MEEGKLLPSERPDNPRHNAGFLKIFTFFYFYEIIKKALRKDFTNESIFKPLPDFKSKLLGEEFEKIWNESLNYKQKNEIGLILWVLFKQFYKFFLPRFIIYLILKVIFTYVQPVLLAKIVAHFRTPNNDSKDIYYYSAGMIISGFIVLLVLEHYTQSVHELVLRISISLSAAIYRKTLRLKSNDLSKINNIGNSITLITKDVFNFGLPLIIISDCFVAFVIVAVQSVSIISKTGYIGLLIFAIAIIGVLIEVVVLGMIAKNRRFKACKYTAERLFVLKQTLSMIRAVKFNALEQFFIKRINNCRKKEIKHLLAIFYVRIGSLIVGNLSSSCSFYISVFTYVWINGTISAELLYFLMLSVDVMKFFFTQMLPNAIPRLGELLASLRRLQTFLLLDEFSQEHLSEFKEHKEPRISAKNLNIYSVKDLSFEIAYQGLIAITGPVGSGKSLLLKAIIGEFGPIEGLDVKGSVSYASQEIWLFPGTIRGNILFGEKFQEERYREVIKECSLIHDFNQLKDGDLTVIIDGGINLSSGQQKRICLARTIYQDKQIYLLDSVFSCLDMRTNKFIFERVIKKFLKDKICILITENLDHCKAADQVIIFNKESQKVIKNQNIKLLELVTCKEEKQLLNLGCVSNKDIYEEQNKTGIVTFSTYGKYIKFCGGFWITGLILALFIATQVLSIASQKIMSVWINQEEKLSKYLKNSTDRSYEELLVSRNRGFSIYIGTFLFSIVFTLFAAFSFFFVTAKSSKIIHKLMLSSVIKAKMEFFCSIPLGIILNRFSKDVNNVDENVPFDIYLIITIFLETLGILILILLTNWVFVIPTVIISFLAFFFMKTILYPVIAKIKRIESALHSPMVGHLNATLNGLSTIRVYHFNHNKLIRDFDFHQDQFASASFIVLCTERCLKVTFHAGLMVFTIIIIGYFMMAKKATPGDVGLGIGKSLVLLRYIRQLLSNILDLEAEMTSLERISEYLNIDQEHRKGLQLTCDWPRGQITFENLSLTYKTTGQNVLKNINLDIKAGEKVGIIGRTGAGKSSLFSCLFRFYEYSGKIIIDGIDIKNVNLDYLRSRIAVVSQDAFIFSGTLQDNLDPIGQYSDIQIMEKLSLLTKNLRIFQNFKLNSIVTEDSLTSGERQLISLLRVLLTNKQIIVLDEVEASLDEETNCVINDVIKNHFEDRTVLIIAHKLKNLQVMDKICLLHDGEVIEFDNPGNLIRNHESELNKILDEC